MSALEQADTTVLERVAESALSTAFGEFEAIAYSSPLDRERHIALVKGDVAAGTNVLVRLHSACLTGDIFGSRRCDCGEQLAGALRMLSEEGRGVLLYGAQEGRGIGLLDKLRAYRLQDDGLDTVDANLALGLPADCRQYGFGARILEDLGVRSIRLLTNNPAKVLGLQAHGITVIERVAIEHRPNRHNERYLRTKAQRMGHLLAGPSVSA